MYGTEHMDRRGLTPLSLLSHCLDSNLGHGLTCSCTMRRPTPGGKHGVTVRDMNGVPRRWCAIPKASCEHSTLDTVWILFPGPGMLSWDSGDPTCFAIHFAQWRAISVCMMSWDIVVRFYRYVSCP